MHLVVIGLNHRTAPVELRERLSIDKAQLPEITARLKGLGCIEECLILSTCNRIEVYAVTCKREDDREITSCIGEYCGISAGDLNPHLYSCAGHKAAEHLFRVAAGTDSMVLGEAQILGQVKEAYSEAMNLGSIGTVLDPLLRQAISVGKRVRTETEIGCGAFSVGSVAVQVANSIFEDLGGRTVLVVGAGKMAGLMMTHLASCGAGKVKVANRTRETAEELASRFSGECVGFDELESALASADIVISSTGAKQPVLTTSTVGAAMRARRGKPIFFIDIAVPRDIEPSVQELDGVFVYDIDDLQSAVQADAESRRAEVAKAAQIIDQEVETFVSWFRTLDAVPVVTALRGKFESIRAAEVQKLGKKLGDLSPEQLKAVDAATRSIVNRICHDPMIRIKEYAASGESPDKLETACEIFGIPGTTDAQEAGRDGD